MYEQKQIIIDGEILGNNVIINRQFESICNISPLIIKNFVNIINEYTFLSKPVRIKKYDFVQNNCIRIFFKSKFSLGEVQLAYVLNKNNELLIDTYNLLITEGENKGYFIAKQNINAKINHSVHKEYNISDLSEEYVTLSSNSQNDVDLVTSELEQINNELVNDTNIELVESVNDIIDETNEDSFALTNNSEENNEFNEALIPNEASFKDDVEFASEDDINDVKKSIYFDNISRKSEDLINSKEEISEQILEENNLNIQANEEKILENTILSSEISVVQSENEISIEVIADTNSTFVENNQKTNQNETTSIIDVEKEYNSNSEDLIITPELNENTEINSSEGNIVSEIINNDDNSIIKNEDDEFKIENIVENDIIFTNTYGADLVDFYDIIPKYQDDILEIDNEDEIEVVAQEENLTQSLDNKNFGYKRNKKNYNLNKKTKIAMYKNILEGYDNKMTKDKLNKFKEKFDLLQADEKLTMDDVLDAQVELLIDNSSKAFRIYESDIKKDVIQIGEELFLSKDKIYTWGDVYYLD